MTNTVHHGDCLTVLKTFPDEFIDCCVTSPPYWALRDYGCDGQLGLEPTFQEYIDKLCNIFDEVKRVLKKEGTCWVNIGDTYNGNKEGKTDNKVCDYLKNTTTNLHKKKGDLPDKCLCQIPSRFAIEMTNRGWILRNEIIWYKPNAMPSSVKDRFTVDFEKVFFFVKNKKYWFEQQLEKSIWFEKDKRAITGGITKSGKSITSEGNQYQINKSGSFRKDGNRNKRCVWQIPTKPFKEAHFAVFPPTLVEPMIQAGCPENGIVLDPFIGSGTVAQVATLHRRNWIGIELNPEYIKLADKRRQVTPRLL
jgi:site-specific DNA-methyltransferase (adenine-specific)